MQGFDHGVFAPMKVMYPQADVPTFQVSLQQGYDVGPAYRLGPRAGAAAGRRGADRRFGPQLHNLRRFGEGGRAPSAAFDAWLSDTVEADPQTRVARLKDWAQAPAARICHPQEDHLIPLMTAVGAAEHETATRVYHDTEAYGGITASSWRFG